MKQEIKLVWPHGDTTRTILFFSIFLTLSKIGASKVKQSDLPNPVDKETKTSFPRRNSSIACFFAALEAGSPTLQPQ